MDKWLSVTKPASERTSHKKTSNKTRYNPYGDRPGIIILDASKHTKQVEKKSHSSSAALTKHLLNTLPDESNPITHSDIYERSEHIVSLASGHQRSERRSGVKTSFVEDRSRKLKEQREEMSTEAMVLNNVQVYINGYLSETTDIEMKRIVTHAGGRVMNTASGATHIVTSHNSLNALATHKYLNTKSKNKVYVVKPEWVTESISRRKRQPEREYTVIKDATTKSLFDSFAHK